MQDKNKNIKLTIEEAAVTSATKTEKVLNKNCETEVHYTHQ